MKKSILLVAVCMCCAFANAAVVVEDFESYSTTDDLIVNWTGYDGLAGSLGSLSLETNPANVYAGSNSMRMDYNLAGVHGLTNFFMPAPQDWSGGTFSFWYKGTGSAEFLWLVTVNEDAVATNHLYLGDYALTNVGDWTNIQVDISGDSGFPDKFDAVGQMQLNIQWGSGGSGTVWVDNLEFIPEPATFMMLGAGGLISLLRRK